MTTRTQAQEREQWIQEREEIRQQLDENGKVPLWETYRLMHKLDWLNRMLA